MVERIILAGPRGFCAGVDRAIRIVELALEAYGAPVYVKHEIVHNKHVISSLSGRGAVFVESLDKIPDGSRVIFSAHGVPPDVRAEASSKGLKVIDATCPLVTKVHLEAKRYAREGFSIILVGHKNHVEVIGTSGEAPDATQVVETVEDAARVQVPDAGMVVCLTQTTLSVDDTKKIVDALKSRFPEIKFPPKEDICYATQNRQNAVKQLAQEVELILVIGSGNSSNSNRLAEAARGAGVASYLVNDESEILPEWLKGVKSVGITAGASAPERLVIGVVDFLKRLGAKTVDERCFIEENMKFVMPVV